MYRHLIPLQRLGAIIINNTVEVQVMTKDEVYSKLDAILRPDSRKSGVAISPCGGSAGAGGAGGSPPCHRPHGATWHGSEPYTAQASPSRSTTSTVTATTTSGRLLPALCRATPTSRTCRPARLTALPRFCWTHERNNARQERYLGTNPSL